MDLMKHLEIPILSLLAYLYLVRCQECGLPYDTIRTSGFIKGIETSIDKASF